MVTVYINGIAVLVPLSVYIAMEMAELEALFAMAQHDAAL